MERINTYRIGDKIPTIRLKDGFKRMNLELYKRPAHLTQDDLPHRRIFKEGLEAEIPNDVESLHYAANLGSYYGTENLRVNIKISRKNHEAELIWLKNIVGATALVIKSNAMVIKSREDMPESEGSMNHWPMFAPLFDESMHPVHKLSLNHFGSFTLEYEEPRLTKGTILAGMAIFGIANDISSIDYKFDNEIIDRLDYAFQRAKTGFAISILRLKDCFFKK